LLAIKHLLTTEQVQHLQIQTLKFLCDNLNLEDKQLNARWFNPLKNNIEKELASFWVADEPKQSKINRIMLMGAEIVSLKAVGWLNLTNDTQSLKERALISVPFMLLVPACLLIKKMCTRAKNPELEHFSYDYNTAHAPLYNTYIEIMK
jgi:hypothetical protein